MMPLEPVAPPQGYSASDGDTAALASILAHRLRSVVAGIQGCAELLADTVPDSDRPLALHILEGTAAIERTITDLLCYSHQPEPVLFPLSVLSVVSQTLEGLGAPPGRIVLIHKFSVDDRMVADPVLFRQALMILIQNALEASPPSTTVAINLTREGGQFKISINNYSTVDTAQLTAFMNPFITTKSNRLGLGLTIARRAVESMCGSLHAYTENGLNSVTFEINMKAM